MRGEHAELRELAVDLHAHLERANGNELEFSEVIAPRLSRCNDAEPLWQRGRWVSISDATRIVGVATVRYDT